MFKEEKQKPHHQALVPASEAGLVHAQQFALALDAP